ncbi:protein-disulfide reductase DsbD family protein [Psychroflexus halocasei]|uniref:Thiol:disulfide interchange protein DsbD n=1 Tax=Psychroflexus halocasei TaxID=908615 RepID=A0A1H3Y1X0_9FLAO|nr:cytochrome c biogenesis protein CcdA [Psychroflexus halocasei]SEA05573.1 thiol:disulfide interchange protein DsbD [Psychroflexus halocasei]
MHKSSFSKALRRMFLLTFLGVMFSANAQFGYDPSDEVDPISFSTEVEQDSEDVYIVKVTAKLVDGWHLPSQRLLKEDELGPEPTELNFSFEGSEAYEIIGETIEPEGIEAYDEIFRTDLKYFLESVTFEQKIKVVDASEKLNLEILFSVCDDEKCLPQDQKYYTYEVVDGALTLVDNEKVEITEADSELQNQLKVDIKNTKSFSKDLERSEEESSIWTVFFLGFIGGFIALLTPCVFPMIPLTVSFFTKSATNKRLGMMNAILYGVFIFAIYVLLSLPFHLLDSVNPEILNNISTNTTLNIIFFVIFMVFAFSFFGYYEITLPNSWSDKLDQKATSVGGVIGIFFMALTLAIVSFSCTGPILGSLLGGSLSASGGAMLLSFGMAGFGLALALPFALFALFPNWLNSLPKSGGWLNTVKVVLGFLEVGLAFKFLSNADLVENWGFLKREVFIGIWVVVGLLLTLYLFGKIRFPHDGPKQPLSKGRLMIATVCLAFTVYLLPGLTNTSYANLKLLSGFPPPLFYSLYPSDANEGNGPLGLTAYHEFEKGVAFAKEQNKPILLDFTGWACVNCRKMEEQVWSIPEVYQTIKDDYVLISLYIDERKELSEDEKFTIERDNGTVKHIRTVGDKWATFQTLNFKNNSQPFYVLLSPELELLNSPSGYESNSDKYLEWLKKGVENFKSK